MAWPFSSVDAPNFDTGPGEDVPVGAPVSLSASQTWLTGAHFTNEGANQVVVTVTNSAGKTLNKFKVPPGGELPYEWAFRPTVGVKWGASASGVKGHLWGYD